LYRKYFSFIVFANSEKHNPLLFNKKLCPLLLFAHHVNLISNKFEKFEMFAAHCNAVGIDCFQCL